MDLLCGNPSLTREDVIRTVEATIARTPSQSQFWLPSVGLRVVVPDDPNFYEVWSTGVLDPREKPVRFRLSGGSPHAVGFVSATEAQWASAFPPQHYVDPRFFRSYEALLDAYVALVEAGR